MNPSSGSSLASRSALMRRKWRRRSARRRRCRRPCRGAVEDSRHVLADCTRSRVWGEWGGSSGGRGRGRGGRGMGTGGGREGRGGGGEGSVRGGGVGLPGRWRRCPGSRSHCIEKARGRQLRGARRREVFGDLCRLVGGRGQQLEKPPVVIIAPVWVEQTISPMTSSGHARAKRRRCQRRRAPTSHTPVPWSDGVD